MTPLSFIGLWLTKNFLLLFRKPPDLFIKMSEDIIIHQRGTFAFYKGRIFLLNCLLLLFAPASSLSWPSFFFPKSHVSTDPWCDWLRQAVADQQLHACMAKKNPSRSSEQWDSDAVPIVVDTATSKTLTPCFSDLIDPRPYKSTVSGIGTGTITHVGKVRWKVIDDNQKEAVLADDEAYYSPSAPYRLLCPHSWKEYQDSLRFNNGNTFGDAANIYLLDNYNYQLSWNRGQNVLTAPLDHQTNLPTVSTAATYHSFCSFVGAFSTFPTVVPTPVEPPLPTTMEMGGGGINHTAKTKSTISS